MTERFLNIYKKQNTQHIYEVIIHLLEDKFISKPERLRLFKK